MRHENEVRVLHTKASSRRLAEPERAVLHSYRSKHRVLGHRVQMQERPRDLKKASDFMKRHRHKLGLGLQHPTSALKAVASGIAAGHSGVSSGSGACLRKIADIAPE